MSKHGLSADWQRKLTGVRAVVWGDLCLDRYRYGGVKELAREAPVPALHLEREVVSGGQAANVALNLAALGAQVHSIGLVGDDPEGYILRLLLENNGVQVDGVLTSKRATEYREKIVAQSSHQPQQHLLHVYRESTRPLGSALQQRLFAKLEVMLAGADVLLVVDYGNGMCLGQITTRLFELAKLMGIKTVANTRRNPTLFIGAQGMIVNRRQTRGYGTLEMMRNRLGLGWLMATEGEQGMTLATDGEMLHVDPPHKLPVLDITGAGDTVLSWIAAGWGSGLDWGDTLHLANHAAQVSVAVEGTAAPTAQEVAAIL
jgi:D-beta-D-heptose 7-phosphate kinase / D-beta-D-heptose 1-phosphate adenosyltransferase